MRALGIETATSIASVGIVVDTRVVSERALPMQGSHARTLLPLIDAALDEAAVRLADLDLIAVSIGPGSFTGLRIALSVAKGLALATGTSVVGVPTLDAYAHHAGRRAGWICPVLDARKGEVYGAAYRWDASDMHCVVAAAAWRPDRFAAAIQGPCTLLGDGVAAYADLWRRELGCETTLIDSADLPPSGAAVAELGVARVAAGGSDDLAGLEPSYCRLSEAELTTQRRESTADVEN